MLLRKEHLRRAWDQVLDKLAPRDGLEPPT
jgi:hypothetical protein